MWGRKQFPQLMRFCLLHKVGDDKLVEDGDTPEADKEKTEAACEVEGKGEDADVEDGLVVHPGENDHSSCKGHHVDPCIQLELL